MTQRALSAHFTAYHALNAWHVITALASPRYHFIERYRMHWHHWPLEAVYLTAAPLILALKFTIDIAQIVAGNTRNWPRSCIMLETLLARGVLTLRCNLWRR